jgi:hypothetical protein
MCRVRYRIREVDSSDEDVAETLADLHRLTFFGSAPMADFDHGHWWVAYREATPIAFAGVIPSTHVHNAGYFCRVGVLSSHCGNRLQLRLMRAMESQVRRNGWSAVVSDTTDNMASANNFIRAGYRLYQPQFRGHGRRRFIGRSPSNSDRLDVDPARLLISLGLLIR